MFPLTLLVAGDGRSTRQLQLCVLGAFRETGGLLLDISSSKKALAMSFVTKDIPSSNGGIIAYTAIQTWSDRGVQ